MSSSSLKASPLPVPSGNRIEKRRVEFSNRITSAALQLFEKQGVAETSVASIIKQADIAHKTFFNHFPTKEHLLLHIATIFGDHAYSVFGEGFDRIKLPRKQLEFVLSNTAEALQATSAHYKELINFYLIAGTGAGGEMQREHRLRFSEVIGQILGDAKAQGTLRGEQSVAVYTEMVVGLVVATILSWSIEAEYPVVERMAQVYQFLDNSLFSAE